MRNPKDFIVRVAKEFKARWRTRHVPEVYLNKNCLPRAP
jgi:hypothetical protein